MEVADVSRMEDAMRCLGRDPFGAPRMGRAVRIRDDDDPQSSVLERKRRSLLEELRGTRHRLTDRYHAHEDPLRGAPHDYSALGDVLFGACERGPASAAAAPLAAPAVS